MNFQIQLNKVIKHENKGRIVIDFGVDKILHEKDIPLCEMSFLI